MREHSLDGISDFETANGHVHPGAYVKPVVFIHTNNKQILGARVGAHLLKTRSKTPEAFEVRLLRLEETLRLYRREGHAYLRKGQLAIWRNEDLQSFSPLRMLVPQEMKFQGRALVLDPDVFAIGDVCELLGSDMQGKAIRCRHVVGGYRENGRRFHASSVMLLDCARLVHWKWDEQIDAMFDKTLDYGQWISLALEDPESIGEILEEWNHFDKLTAETKLLHNTERSTQPWKTGLPVDFGTTTTRRSRRSGWIRRKLSSWGLFEGGTAPLSHYRAHPDPNQERFFLEAVRECLNQGVIDEGFVRSEIELGHIRADLLERVRELGEQQASDWMVTTNHG